MADSNISSEEQNIEETLLRKDEQIEQRPYRHWHANFGLIASLGGVIIVPILLGVIGGGWLDENYPQTFSWRLSGLFLGFMWGLMNAYFWLNIENKKIEKMNFAQKGNDHEQY